MRLSVAVSFLSHSADSAPRRICTRATGILHLYYIHACVLYYMHESDWCRAFFVAAHVHVYICMCMCRDHVTVHARTRLSRRDDLTLSFRLFVQRAARSRPPALHIVGGPACSEGNEHNASYSQSIALTWHRVMQSIAAYCSLL